MSKVFLHYDQAGLDAAYDQAVWAPNRDQVLARYAATSGVARAHLGEPVRIAYGPAAIEGCDLYRAAVVPAPIQIFVHGGAWRSGTARDYGFPAETFVRAGAHYVAIDFSHVQDAAGDLRVLADQVRHAIAAVYREADGFGGDRDRIYLTGHSSGAHLAAVALTTDWSAFGLPADVIKGGCCVSGIYDLAPVRLSARSRYVAFDDAMEQALSPLRHVSRLRAPLVVACGSLESPEFQRQAGDFAAAVAAAGAAVRVVAAPDYNHFEIIETLANPHGLIGRESLAQMGLG